MDLDRLHSVLQYPVATIEVTIAIALAMRWHGARHNTVSVDSVVTGLLAIFVGLIGLKQFFWSVWGALVARDLFGSAVPLQNHWAPVAFNAAISIVGLALLARLASLVFGRGAYALTSIAFVGVVAIGIVLAGRG